MLALSRNTGQSIISGGHINLTLNGFAGDSITAASC